MDGTKMQGGSSFFKHLRPILLVHTQRLLLARVPFTLPSKSWLEEVKVREIPPPAPPPQPAKHPTLFPADFFLVREEKRVVKELKKD